LTHRDDIYGLTVRSTAVDLYKPAGGWLAPACLADLSGVALHELCLSQRQYRPHWPILSLGLAV